MITLETRKVVKVDPPKAGYYMAHFDDGSSQLLARFTRKLGVLAKQALIPWAANIEHEHVFEMACGVHVENILSPTKEQFAQELRARLGDTWDEKKKKWVGKKQHQKKLKEAGAIGTSLHKAIQEHLSGDMGLVVEEPNLEGLALLAYMAWEDWAGSVELEPTHVETRLASEHLDVGGTMDCAGYAFNPEMDGKKTHTLFDWKSSKRSDGQKNGIYPESEIQLASYRAMAIEMGLLDDDSWAAVVRLPKNEDDPCLQEKEPFDVLWLSPDRCDELASGFEHISKTWSFMQEAFPK